MNYDIINKTKENLDKLKQILSINEVLTSAIDIVDDLTNTKMPEYNNELEKNKCFFIDMFKTTYPNVNTWTLDEVRQLLSILKPPLTKITDNTVETKKIELIKEIELIEHAIESYNEIQKLKINQLVINNLVTTSIDIIEQANRQQLASSTTSSQKSSILATTITDAIFNSLSNNTFNKQWESLKSSVNISSQTMKNIYNNTGKRLKGMFSYSMTEKNKYLDILNKNNNTINGICAELNKIVLVIANDVCEMLKKLFTNTQSDITAAQSGTTTGAVSVSSSIQPGALSMHHSRPCPNPIPSEFQLLGTYDNTDIYYDGQKNEFCTNNLPNNNLNALQTTSTVTSSTPSPTPTPNTSINGNLNNLVNIAVDVIDNIKKQNTNINTLVDTAVNIISNPKINKA